MKKIIFLVLVFSCFSFVQKNIKSNEEIIEVVILVDGKLWEEKNTIDETSEISIQLNGLDEKYEYNFDEISVKWTLLRQKVGRKNKKKLKRSLVGRVKTFNVHPQKRHTTQEGLADCYECDKYDLQDSIGEYQGFSKSPKIVFPFKVFYDPCLSRVILKIEKLQVKLPNGKIQMVRNFAYKKDFSLWPRWYKCRNVDYNGQQD